jgi:hypothetical protein
MEERPGPSKGRRENHPRDDWMKFGPTWKDLE